MDAGLMRNNYYAKINSSKIEMFRYKVPIG